jgi:hypothetical protein
MIDPADDDYGPDTAYEAAVQGAADLLTTETLEEAYGGGMVDLIVAAFTVEEGKVREALLDRIRSRDVRHRLRTAVHLVLCPRVGVLSDEVLDEVIAAVRGAL